MSKRRPRGIPKPPPLVGVARRRSMSPLPAMDLIDCMRQCGIQLPEELVAVEVKLSADSITQIIYTCNVTGALEHKMGQAMQLHAVKERLAK